jgi:hypothetical protein
MIKLTINRFRDFTEEEKTEKRESRKYCGLERDEPLYRDKVMENTLEVEITDEQFEAIRKAVLEKF